MCGFAGFINFFGHDMAPARVQVKRMTDTIIHRGPDAEGHYVDGSAALGHRRLSIIDLAGGHQPMSDMAGEIHIVFNGEIYNFLTLKNDLENLGYRFQTRSDTEVILLAYKEWGESFVDHLHGMFAFAIWDSKQRRLILARDRVGKKPLYYYESGSTIFFASELKAILKVLGSRPEINPRALDCYFTLGYVPSPMTIFEGMKKLPPASVLVLREGNSVCRRYWNLNFGVEQGRGDGEFLEELESVFDGAVRDRLISEVPLGAFLSGGIDSTLVVSSMAKFLDKPVLTNTIGFEEATFNELPVAREVAEHLHTDHREYVIKADAAEIIDKIAWHFDEPFADSSAVPTWYVCQMARRNVTVALSGDGGDEGFGGYTFRYLPHLLESSLRSALPVWFRGPVFGMIGSCYPGFSWLPKPLRLKSIFENLSISDGEAFYNDLIFLRADTRERLYNQGFMKMLKGFSPFELVRPLYADGTAGDPLTRSQQADINFYMTEDVLVKVDRMSMAHALEVRSPLLDHRILEFAAKLPAGLKIDKRHGKILLRRLAARRLPEKILQMPKRGFSIPAAAWLRGELKEVAKKMIFAEHSLASQYLNQAEVKKVWDEHQAGVRDHNVFLWGLMMLGLWEKNFYH